MDLLLANVGEFPRYTLQSYLFDGNWLMGLRGSGWGGGEGVVFEQATQ